MASTGSTGMGHLRRGHGVLAALTALAALWVYLLAYTPLGGGLRPSDATRFWNVVPAQVTALHYRDGAVQVTLRPEPAPPGAEHPILWVTHAGPGTAVRRPGATDAPAPTVTQTFRGNAAARQAWDALLAGQALRLLAPLEELDGAAFGLEDGAAYLEATLADNATRRVRLGRTAHDGAARYLHDPRSGWVALVPSTPLRRLRGGPGVLVDRELLALKPEAAARAELVVDGVTRTLHALPGGHQWAATADAAAPDEAMGAAMRALSRLQVLRYLPREQAPQAAPALELRLYRAGEPAPAAWLRLYGLAGSGGVARAASSYTRGPVAVAQPLARRALKTARALPGGG